MRYKRIASVGAAGAIAAAMLPITAFAVQPSKHIEARPFSKTIQGEKPGAQATAVGLIVKFKANSEKAKEVRAFSASVGERGAAPEVYNQVKDAAKSAGVDIRSAKANGLDTSTFRLAKAESKENVKKAINKISKIKDVEYVEPDLRMYALNTQPQPSQLLNFAPTATTPNDPRYSDQWDLKNTAAGMSVEGAWKHTKGNGVTVAVIDTGMIDHPDLQSHVIGGYDFISDPSMSRDGDGRDSDYHDQGDWLKAGECGGGYPRHDQPSSWHGTHVAGTIAAIENNKQGIVGIAPEANILVARVLGRCGGASSDIADAITWTTGGDVPGMPHNDHPARVVNMSLGGDSLSCPRVYQDAIDDATRRGAVVVVAAGNESQDARRATPANCKNVITVGATGEKGNQSYFSNFGPKVTISAPGGDDRQGDLILSTVDAGKTTPEGPAYGPMEGTSQATPHVAGLVALMLAANPNLDEAQVTRLLQANAKKIGRCPLGACGSGIIDATKTINAVVGDKTDPSEPGEPDNPSDPGTSVNPTIKLSASKVAYGQNLDIQASGFVPGEIVGFFVDGNDGKLGQLTADRNGNIYAHWRVQGIDSGYHRLYAYGAKSKQAVYQSFKVISSYSYGWYWYR